MRFARHNLVADPTPPPGAAAFDVIVCRNVLIYFDIEEPRRLLERREADALRTACGARPKLVGDEGRGT